MAESAVGCGADWWFRRTNIYAGCSCPPARYNPREIKPTDPECPAHGTQETT